LARIALARDPVGSWMLRDGDMNKLSPVVAQNEKAKQQLEGHRRHDKKID